VNTGTSLCGTHAKQKLLVFCLQGGRAVFRGGRYGQGSGEGETLGIAPVHHVTIHDHHHGQVVEVDIPEDRCEPRLVLTACWLCCRHPQVTARDVSGVHAS
jgi:hypothetical protein